MRVHFLILPVVLLAALPGLCRAQQAVTARSPDGNRVATAKDMTISVTEAQTGKELMRMRAHKVDITALAFAPDGKVLASADRDGRVLLFDAATGKLIRDVKTVPGVNMLKFSADGKKLEVKSPGATRSVDVATGKLE